MVLEIILQSNHNLADHFRNSDSETVESPKGISEVLTFTFYGTETKLLTISSCVDTRKQHLGGASRILAAVQKIQMHPGMVHQRETCYVHQTGQKVKARISTAFIQQIFE